MTRLYLPGGSEIVGTKLTHPDAVSIKEAARARKSTVSALVRMILQEWMRKEHDG